MTTRIPCKRPRVVVTTEPTAIYWARCEVPGCSWGYGPALKSDAQQHATWHRQQHRAAVPVTEIWRVAGTAGVFAICHDCTDASPPRGRKFAGRDEAEGWVAYHLTTKHGLAVCP